MSAVEPAVVAMLKEDHAKVKSLFEEFKQSEGREQAEIAKTALQELEIHAELEEKLIYPTIREAIDDDEQMTEAVEEHHLVHILIRELKSLKASDVRFRAKFSVLSELVKHHIEEEESEMLPKAEESGIDWKELEMYVMKKREQLMRRPKSDRSGGRGRGRKMSSRNRRK
jgi:hemerythrin superfamily protein